MRTQLQLNQAVQIRSQLHKASLGGVVVSYSAAGIGIWFPQVQQLPVGFEVGTRVQFRYCDYAGVHTAVTEVLQTQAGPRSGVLLRLPDRFETTQKRKFFRQACYLPTAMELLTLPQPTWCGEVDPTAIIEDLSAGGARVRSRFRVAEGDRVRFLIRRPSDGEPGATPAPEVRPAARDSGAVPLKNTFPARPMFVKAAVPDGILVQGRVLRIRQDTYGDEPTFTLGIEFSGIGVADQDRLVAFVFDLQRAQAKHPHAAS